MKENTNILYTNMEEENVVNVTIEDMVAYLMGNIRKEVSLSISLKINYITQITLENLSDKESALVLIQLMCSGEKAIVKGASDLMSPAKLARILDIRILDVRLGDILLEYNFDLSQSLNVDQTKYRRLPNVEYKKSIAVVRLFELLPNEVNLDNTLDILTKVNNKAEEKRYRR